MVKTKQPLFSLDATGKLGKALQFGHWKGRTVAGKRRNPAQPRTRAQLATRVFMTWLNNQWRTFTPSQTATWENAPNPRGLPLYHVYLAYNMNRIKRLIDITHSPFHMHALPSMTYPATETGNWGWWTGGTKTPMSKSVRWDRNVGNLQEQWGMIYFIGPAPMYRPTYNILVAVETVTTPGTASITIKDLPPGPVTINMMQFTKSGNSPTYLNFFNVTILP